jgi:hypothetical protein
MGLHGNGFSRTNGSAAPPHPPAPAAESERCPRRIVLLSDGAVSDVRQVLAEYRGGEVSGKRLHADLHRLAAEHPGQLVAAEWLGKLGWTRFLWCQK